jgi:hypothetical protein
MKTLACEDLSIQMRHFLLVSVLSVFAFGPAFSGDGMEFLKISNPAVYSNADKVYHMMFFSLPATISRLFNLGDKSPTEIALAVDMALLRRACVVACGCVRTKCINKSVVVSVLASGLKSMGDGEAKNRLQSRIDMVNAAKDEFSSDFMLWPSTLETLSLIIKKFGNFSLAASVISAFEFENAMAAPHAGQALSDIVPTNTEMAEIGKSAIFSKKFVATDSDVPRKQDMRALAVILYLLECDYFGYGPSFVSNFADLFLQAVGDSTRGTALGSSRFPVLTMVNTANRTMVWQDELLVLPHNAAIDDPISADGSSGGEYAGFDSDLLVLLEDFRIDKTCRKNIDAYLLNAKNRPQQQPLTQRNAVKK